jgi:pyruvate/2-oxoglutarate dehydrogenase complex dihydrolipoamide dehydrogenase (E3) component
MARYDNNLIVIGGGSAGLIAAYIAATVRARVTLIERGAMGGDCLNTGCVPSKALLASARVAATLRNADRYGIAPVTPDVDFAAVMTRVQSAVARIEPKDSMARYRSLGVDCVAGAARIVDPHHVAVGDRVLSTRSIVIATGARPALPPIPGLDQVHALTSENVWSLRERPQRLLVLGGGPIGCELAQAFARLGSRVTLVDLEPRLLPREDAEVGALVEGSLRTDGVDVRLAHRANRFVPGLNGAGELHADSASGATTIAFDRVLVAVGRRAVTEGIGLEAIGVTTTPAGTIAVDDYLRTACANVYACGDCVGPYQFTHMASHQAWYASVNALFGWARKFRVNYNIVPWATYTEPEVARVGLSEEQAQQSGRRFEVTRLGFDDHDRSIADGATEGFIKVLTEPGRDRIIGVTIVGQHAGELLAEYVFAMSNGLGLKALMSTIHVYPTLAESAKLTAGAWRRAHAPQGLLRIAGWLHALRR